MESSDSYELSESSESSEVSEAPGVLTVDNVEVGEKGASAIAQASNNASISRDRGEGGGEADQFDDISEPGVVSEEATLCWCEECEGEA